MLTNQPFCGIVCFVDKSTSDGVNTVISRFERFTYAISEINRYWHKIAADEMSKYGLKGPFAMYLTVLYRHPDGVTSVQLGELCDKNKADVSRAVATLEEKNLIVREANNNSLYRAKIRLTKEGKHAAEQVQGAAARAVEMGGDGLTDERREVFYSGLERIAANLKIVSENGLNKK